MAIVKSNSVLCDRNEENSGDEECSWDTIHSAFYWVFTVIAIEPPFILRFQTLHDQIGIEIQNLHHYVTKETKFV